MHRDFVVESATRLGLWDRGEICVGDENELAAIFEHATFDVRINGRNAAEIFIDTLSLEDSSDEALVARAFLDARYSVFIVVEIAPGAGVRLRDVFDGTLYDVTDIGFGLSQKVGARLAGRLLPLEQFWMTTGCSLPVNEELFRKIVSKLERKFPEGVAVVRADPERCSRMNSMVIAACIASGAASTILYTNLDGPSAPRRKSGRLPGVDAPERHKIGRNELCPCGSGVKYKKCCGRVGRGSAIRSA